jgi:hypothetical protein
LKFLRFLLLWQVFLRLFSGLGTSFDLLLDLLNLLLRLPLVLLFQLLILLLGRFFSTFCRLAGVSACCLALSLLYLLLRLPLLLCFRLPLFKSVLIFLLLLLLFLLLFLLVLLLLPLSELLLDFLLIALWVHLGLLVLILLKLAVAVREFLELSNEEAVHVVHMGVDPAGQVETGVESLFLVLGVTGLTDLIGDAELHKLHIARTKCVINYPFILFDGDGAS